VLDLVQLTAALQAQSDSRFGGGANPDSPQWQLLAHAGMSRLSAGPADPARPYVLVWVADDIGDADGDRHHDSNGLVMMHAEAYGRNGARRIVDATISRVLAEGGGAMLMPAVRLVSWRQVR
jgi:hypothetical protein